jgi:cbb3-type cytochrome oxidase cytochrome c subunit
MDLWVFIIIIVAIGSVVKIVEPIISKRYSQESDQVKKQNELLQERIRKQDERINNLETIVLEQQRDKKYDDLK